MSRRHALFAAAAILVSLAAIIIGWKISQGRQGPDDIQQTESSELTPDEGETRVVELFFPGPGGRLFAEEREIPPQDDLLAKVRLILDGLLAGPETEDLFPALPPEVTVDWLHLNPAGIFYVDLKFSGEVPFPAWGSRQEMLAVYSIVNTLLTSSPEIRSVVLLRNGQQRPTFAGHLDTSRPLVGNQQIVAQR
jgi:hypothetical protein